jgi:hypothetical protein
MAHHSPQPQVDILDADPGEHQPIGMTEHQRDQAIEEMRKNMMDLTAATKALMQKLGGESAEQSPGTSARRKLLLTPSTPHSFA